MKRECTVCMKEKFNGWMANTCDTHEPLVCKACMKEWLKQCETCPICRAVVHARAVMPGKKRARSESEAEEAEEAELEAHFAAERAKGKEKEKREQEERDAAFARELVEAEARREAREIRMRARFLHRLFAHSVDMEALASMIRSGGELAIVVDE